MGSLSRKYQALYKPYFQINARMLSLALIPSRTGLSKLAYPRPFSLSPLPPSHRWSLLLHVEATAPQGIPQASRAAALSPQLPAPPSVPRTSTVDPEAHDLLKRTQGHDVRGLYQIKRPSFLPRVTNCT